ncbi:hypothetical protein, partial [Xanthovirga aplysinae]|uniref:hypothetical protein n=1 Tax=Xanthovirga aplysinae TaxID=2529853 RepID=UPI001CA4277A
MLLAHFNLFWQTAKATKFEKWGYLGFLFVILGPIITFFATHILLQRGDVRKTGSSGKTVKPNRNFFYLLILLHFWVFLAILWIGEQFRPGDIIDLALVVLLFIIPFIRNVQYYRISTLIGIIFIFSTVLINIW